MTLEEIRAARDIMFAEAVEVGEGTYIVTAPWATIKIHLKELYYMSDEELNTMYKRLCGTA